MSKADELKNKIKSGRNARSALMNGVTTKNENENINNDVNVNNHADKNTNKNVNNNVNNNVHNNVHVNEHDNTHNNDNKNIDNNENINENINNNNNSFLNELVSGKPKRKSDTLVNSGIYFEPDIYKVLQDLAKKGGRGAKSKIVNESLRKDFIAAGLLPDKK